jgi:hypothetical protein
MALGCETLSRFLAECHDRFGIGEIPLLGFQTLLADMVAVMVDVCNEVDMYSQCDKI